MKGQGELSPQLCCQPLAHLLFTPPGGGLARGWYSSLLAIMSVLFKNITNKKVEKPYNAADVLAAICDASFDWGL